MKKVQKCAMMAVAALTPVLAAGAARADSVSYETFGSFSGTGGDTATNSPGFQPVAGPGGGGAVSSVTSFNGNLKLTFTGMPVTTSDSSMGGSVGATFQLGTFSLTPSTAATGTFATGMNQEMFTIHIMQTSPAGGPATSVATVTGTITPLAGTAVIMTFAPSSINTLPSDTSGLNETYVLQPVVGVNAVTQPNGSTFTAQVIGPTFIPPNSPLPKSAFAGVGLLGLLGLSKLRAKPTIA